MKVRRRLKEEASKDVDGEGAGYDAFCSIVRQSA